MVILGIDPGLDGALVTLGTDGRLLEWLDMPTLPTGKAGKRDIDLRALAHYLTERATWPAYVFCEQLQSMPGISRQACFSMGRSEGVLLGILHAARMAHELVRPQQWQRVMLAGVGGTGKGRSLAKAAALYPNLPLVDGGRRRKPRDGRADAALIATYGWRAYRGEVQP